MSNLNDILVRVANKDHSAFQTLYKEASPKLFSLSLKLMACDKTAAEEVLRESFIKIWNQAENFDADKDNAMTWMGTVARNQSFDNLRAYKAQTILAQLNNKQTNNQNVYRQQVSTFKDMLDNKLTAKTAMNCNSAH